MPQMWQEKALAFDVIVKSSQTFDCSSSVEPASGSVVLCGSPRSVSVSENRVNVAPAPSNEIIT